MRLSNLAITCINTPAMRMKIALKVNRDYTTVFRWIKENKDDGELTRKSVVEFIKDETKLTEEQIFGTELVK